MNLCPPRWYQLVKIWALAHGLSSLFCCSASLKASYVFGQSLHSSAVIFSFISIISSASNDPPKPSTPGPHTPKLDLSISFIFMVSLVSLLIQRYQKRHHLGPCPSNCCTFSPYPHVEGFSFLYICFRLSWLCTSF